MHAAIANIGTNMPEKLDRNLKFWLFQYIDEDGGHLQDVVFKTY